MSRELTFTELVDVTRIFLTGPPSKEWLSAGAIDLKVEHDLLLSGAYALLRSEGYLRREHWGLPESLLDEIIPVKEEGLVVFLHGRPHVQRVAILAGALLAIWYERCSPEMPKDTGTPEYDEAPPIAVEHGDKALNQPEERVQAVTGDVRKESVPEEILVGEQIAAAKEALDKQVQEFFGYQEMQPAKHTMGMLLQMAYLFLMREIDPFALSRDDLDSIFMDRVEKLLYAIRESLKTDGGFDFVNITSL